MDGVTLFDKAIQTRDRTKSNPIWAYNSAKRQKVQVEVFNGEIGTVKAFGFDNKIWNTLKSGYGPRLKRFAVQFTRKPGVTVGYGREVPHDGKYKRNEKVEDNLELAYAVSIHKAQGSEFADTFVIIPSSKARPVSAELVYTALTRTVTAPSFCKKTSLVCWMLAGVKTPKLLRLIPSCFPSCRQGRAYPSPQLV